MIELSLFFGVILGYLLWRKERQLDTLLREFALERGGLLQRIQAPEIASLQFAQDANEPLALAVEWDNDEDYAQAVAERKANG